MNKLYTQNAAIKYLREQTGQMSLKVFVQEVQAGRIPEKPYGKGVRYRQEDLDRWQTITHIHHIDCSKEANTGTRISRSLFKEEGLSFAKRLAKQNLNAHKSIAQNA